MLKTSGIEVSGDLRIWYSAVQYGTVRYSDSKNQNITCFVFNSCTSRLTDGHRASVTATWRHRGPRSWASGHEGGSAESTEHRQPRQKSNRNTAHHRVTCAKMPSVRRHLGSMSVSQAAARRASAAGSRWLGRATGRTTTHCCTAQRATLTLKRTGASRKCCGHRRRIKCSITPARVISAFIRVRCVVSSPLSLCLSVSLCVSAGLLPANG